MTAFPAGDRFALEFLRRLHLVRAAWTCNSLHGSALAENCDPDSGQHPGKRPRKQAKSPDRRQPGECLTDSRLGTMPLTADTPAMPRKPRATRAVEGWLAVALSPDAGRNPRVVQILSEHVDPGRRGRATAGGSGLVCARIIAGERAGGRARVTVVTDNRKRVLTGVFRRSQPNEKRGQKP